jgi:hypothetical protein
MRLLGDASGKIHRVFKSELAFLQTQPFLGGVVGDPAHRLRLRAWQDSLTLSGRVLQERQDSALGRTVAFPNAHREKRAGGISFKC